MEATAKRRIKDGGRFSRFFPKAKGANETIKRRADLEDTLDLLPKVVARYNWQAAAIAAELQGRNLRETCRNIWNFCYEYIQYTKDAPGTEQLRTPARTWADRKHGVDCDCYTVFISCILHHIRLGGTRGIPHKLRVTAYENGSDDLPDFQHIYVIVPTRGGHITIDPVVDAFDYEVPYQRKREINMDLQVLNGLQGRHAPPDGVGSVDFEDLFDDEMSAHFGAGPGELDQLSVAEVAALKDGMSLESWNRQNRLEFIERTGMPPEEWATAVKSDLQDGDGLGLFRRKKRGPKKKKKRKGLFKKIINKVNKFNPAAALLRAGILAALKLNYMNVARRIRWGGIEYKIAKRQNPRNMTPQKWTRVRKSGLRGLLNTHIIAGGKEDNFLGAIYYGKGNIGRNVRNRITDIPRNAKRPRRLAGLGETESVDLLHLDSSITDVLGYEVMQTEELDQLTGFDSLNGTLGEVSAAAAIGAATAALGAIAAILKAIGKVEDEEAPAAPGLPAPTGNPLIDKINQVSTTATAAANTVQQIRNDFQNPPPRVVRPASPTATAQGDSTGTEMVMMEESGLVTDPNAQRGASAPPKGKFMEFVSKYKWWLMGGGGLALGGIALAIWKPWKKSPSKATRSKATPALAGTKGKPLGNTRAQRSAYSGDPIPALPTGPVKLGKKRKPTPSVKRKATKAKTTKKKATVSGIDIT